MDVFFADHRLADLCNQQQRLTRAYGALCAKRITLRLAQLRAAPNLADLRQAPGRYHELHGDRAGQIACDLEHPKRLVFIPAHDPPPSKPDGGLDWAAVTAVCIISVEDYHG